MQEPCRYGEKCSNPYCTYVHLNAPKKLIKCYHFFGKGCIKGDACPFLHIDKEQAREPNQVEEVRQKRPASEKQPSPEKKVKVVAVEEEVKPVVADVQLATAVKPPPAANASKIMTLDEIKAKKQAKKKPKKPAKADSLPQSKPAETSPLIKPIDPAQKVLTLEEIKAKKAENAKSKHTGQSAPEAKQPTLQQAPDPKPQLEPEPITKPQKRPRDNEDLEPSKKPKVEIAEVANISSEDIAEPSKLWKEAVFNSPITIEETELAQMIAAQLSTTEGIIELVCAT